MIAIIMESNDSIKLKIEGIVADYKSLFPDEYSLIVKYLKQKRDLRINKFAEIKKTDFIVRALFEIPETLSNMISSKMNKTEKEYWKTKECAKWFINRFKEFRITEAA